jgi:hypothetical protein
MVRRLREFSVHASAADPMGLLATKRHKKDFNRGRTRIAVAAGATEETHRRKQR